MKCFFILIFLPSGCLSQSCAWLDFLKNKAWKDSDKGSVTFTENALSGWSFTDLLGNTISDWECFYNIDYSTYTVVIPRATQTITVFSTDYYVYMCMKTYQISAYSYYYYMQSVEEPRLNNIRLTILETSVAITDAEAQLCVADATGPTTNEYHLLVRTGRESDILQDCPSHFVGYFWYTLTDSTGSYCDDTSVWNGCNNTEIAFNYTQCTTQVAYSGSGTVSCVFSTTSGSNTLNTVINLDGSSTYEFVCFMSIVDGSTVKLSVSPGSCTKDQTIDAIPVSADGAISGQTLLLTPHTISSCEVPTTTTTTTTSTTTTTITTTTTTTPTTTTTTTTTPTTTTTTTTTPTTTTTTPTTTTTTTPTTTTTTPTTTTTSTTTTTTTPTTTTSTTPTTTTSTSTSTTTPAPTSTTTESDDTLIFIAAGLGGFAALAVLALIIGVIIYKCTRKRPPTLQPSPLPIRVPSPEPPPSTPDVVLETLPHKLYGAATILPRALDNPPRETSFLKSIKPKRDIIIFPQAKSTDFKLTLPSKSDAVPSFASSRGTFHHYSESFHPPPSNKRPESFYNTNIAKSPISEKPNTSSSRNIDSVTVNLSNSPQEKPWLHNKLKRQPSTTSLGDSKDSSAYAKLPAALEPEPVKSYDPVATNSTTTISKNAKSRLSSVNIPQTAQPIIISPEICRSVNVKSRTDASSSLEINRVTNHDNTGIETPLNELNEEHNPFQPKETETQNRVFETLPLTEANVSKQSHDIILTNTPNTLDATAQSPFTNCQTNDDVSLPVSRQDSTIHNDSSVDATTPFPTIVDETASNVEATEDVNSNMEDISSENKKLQMADIDLI